MATLLVLTNLPDRESAEKIARAAVEERVAACVNILGTARSVYRWQGAVEVADEVPVFLKTTEDRYGALERLIRELHPYDLPEIIAIPVESGLADYLDWVAEETRPEAPPAPNKEGR